jgi:hypothetical protein
MATSLSELKRELEQAYGSVKWDVAIKSKHIYVSAIFDTLANAATIAYPIGQPMQQLVEACEKQYNIALRKAVELQSSEGKHRRFDLIRFEDETNISGTGRVAEGVQFSNGKCVMSWTTDVSSVVVYESIEDVEYIHGHQGKTVIKWIDDG